MPLYTADALVLRTYKLGEADRIVVFLTRDRGKKRGVAKGARRPRSRFTGALEPLTEVTVAYFEKERRELVGLNYAETRRSPLNLDSQDALGHVSYFAELLDEWAQEADADDRLYRLGASMLDALSAGARQPLSGSRRRLIGMRPLTFEPGVDVALAESPLTPNADSRNLSCLNEAVHGAEIHLEVLQDLLRSQEDVVSWQVECQRLDLTV